MTPISSESSSTCSIGTRLRNILQDLGVDVSRCSEEEVGASMISLPKLEYGYRTIPFTWPELVEIIEKEKNLAKLSRSESQQREYEIFRYHLRRSYHSVVDYVLCSKFGFGKTESSSISTSDRPASTVVWQAQPQLSEYQKVKKVLVPNDFPYCMAEGIVHYILWKTKQDITDQDIVDARRDLGKSMQVVDILHWINPPHLKSLPEIDHVHFLCLLKTDDPLPTNHISKQYRKK